VASGKWQVASGTVNITRALGLLGEDAFDKAEEDVLWRRGFWHLCASHVNVLRDALCEFLRVGCFHEVRACHVSLARSLVEDQNDIYGT
jgi:hypothetical protein